jgi:hypothetical protein
VIFQFASDRRIITHDPRLEAAEAVSRLCCASAAGMPLEALQQFARKSGWAVEEFPIAGRD